jgi:hypothetical protein
LPWAPSRSPRPVPRSVRTLPFAGDGMRSAKEHCRQGGQFQCAIKGGPHASPRLLPLQYSRATLQEQSSRPKADHCLSARLNRQNAWQLTSASVSFLPPIHAFADLGWNIIGRSLISAATGSRDCCICSRPVVALLDRAAQLRRMVDLEAKRTCRNIEPRPTMTQITPKRK